MSLTRDDVLALQQRGLRDWVRMMGASSPGAERFEAEGVAAAIVPATPARSISNSVTYSDAAALLGNLDEIGERYERAGVEAWTVWVPDLDGVVIAALEARGHVFDGKPAAMALELSHWRPPDVGDLDWDSAAEGELLGRLNDLAYGLAAGDGFGGSLVSPPDFARLYQARVEGEPACVLGTIDHDGEDLGFYFVATHPDHRGRGLASRLMTVALADARERGLETSSLQGSPMGEPVYRRLGYESYFRMQLYEKRR